SSITTTTVGANGSWTVTVFLNSDITTSTGTQAPIGVYSLTATQTLTINGVRLTSQPSAPFSVTVYAPPPAPLVTSPATATVVAGSSFTLIGHVMPSATVQVYDNGVLLALPTIVANSLGFWTTTFTPDTSVASHTI